MNYRQPFVGEYAITQRYGETYTSAFHTGIDYACPVTTPILASEAGQVMFSGWDNTGFGYCVIIKHDDGNATLYAHLTMVVCKIGQKVERSQIIGYSGSTGNSTGPHLHFEARKVWNDYKSHFDPMNLPLMTVDDKALETVTDCHELTTDCNQLKEANQLGERVKIVCPDGAWGWSPKFDKRQTVFQRGTKLHFTGKTTERNNYTYCECYPEPVKFWVAVHDGTTQILDNDE